MDPTTPNTKTFLVGVALAALALPTLFGPPSVITPYPRLVLIGAYTVGFPVVLLPPILFWAWSPQLFTGEAHVPSRSAGLLAILTVLTVVYIVAGWAHGIRYDGLPYVIGVTILNGVVLLALWARLRRARSHPSYADSLAFHALLFGWLVWCAFPNMGELP